MNKMLLSLPKSILKKYVENNFSKLTLEDFFEVSKKIQISSYYISKNDILNKNSDVLYYMLDIDEYSFRYFKNEAFSNECINKIADLKIEIQPRDIDEYPTLLENNRICEKVVELYPNIIKKINSEQITNKIISILEKTSYIVDMEDIEKSSLFLESDILIKRAVANGFAPTKQDFYSNQLLRSNELLLLEAFKKDPSIIVLFNKEQLKEEFTKIAYQKGFVAEERDLIENQALCNFEYIMKPAIEKNPRLITLSTNKCCLDFDFLRKTFEKYKLTKEDLEKNPNLAKNNLIMSFFPELELYAPYLDESKKQTLLLNCLKNGEIIKSEKLPFLDYKFGGKADINKMNELVNYLKLTIDKNNINEQQNYFQILDKIIDGIVNIRYIQNKFTFKYPDIVALNDSIIELFNNIETTNDYNLLSKFSNDLYLFVGEYLNIEDIQNELINFYNLYKEKKSIDLSITNEFCNKILNQHRNCFMSREKEKILVELKTKFNLTEKKENTIISGKKIEIITNKIRNNNLDSLGVTEEQFKQLINDTKNIILNNKDIKKLGIQIDVDRLNLLVSWFRIYGSLFPENVIKILNIENFDVAKFIANKFENIKFKLINKVDFTDNKDYIFKLEKEKIGLNYANYVIVDDNRYFKNLTELLLKLDDELLNKILENKELICEIINLLPMLNLIEELNVETFINILCNYERVRNKILGNQEGFNSENLILKNLDDLIFLSNAYSSIDDITLFALGRNIVSNVGEHLSNKYLDFYLNMLNRQVSNIPPISMKTENFYLESGLYSDPERLLIGKVPNKDSCIDLLNSAGKDTYEELLLENSGDVILIRDKSKKLKSRILVFRRGNVIQMVTSSREYFSFEVYKEIANQIMQQSISNNDNIDYVFVDSGSISKVEENHILIEDNRFQLNFSHADFTRKAILVGSKSIIQGENSIELKFDEKPQAYYKKSRKKISYNPTETEITRLRALSIEMEKDVEIKETKAREFTPFYIKEYEKVVCGEDWYIAIKQDGTLEEMILQSNDNRTYDEVEQVKETLGLGNNINL